MMFMYGIYKARIGRGEKNNNFWIKKFLTNLMFLIMRENSLLNEPFNNLFLIIISQNGYLFYQNAKSAFWSLSIL